MAFKLKKRSAVYRVRGGLFPDTIFRAGVYWGHASGCRLSLRANFWWDIDAPRLLQPFTYRLPEGLSAGGIGDAVLIPFGPSRELIGVAARGWPLAQIALPKSPAKRRRSSAWSKAPNAFDQSLWETARWVSRQTLCTRAARCHFGSLPRSLPDRPP